MTALLTDNLPLLAGAPNGIKKLRELILELAVRGKLVPQDPSDEPASELLKRIAEEKARLVAEGKIKKQKPLADICEEEKSFELPAGWEWGRLGDCSKQVTDGEHLTPPRTPDESQIPLVTAKNVRDGYMDYTTTDFVVRSVAEKCWERCCPEQGDIMMVSVGATLGRLTVVPTNQEMVIVRSVTLIKPSIINIHYLALALKSPAVQQSIWTGVKQSAQPCLYLSQSTQLLISIPPLAEQHRIVAKVDELMALCDRLEAQQADAESAHAQLVQALLDSLIREASDATDLTARDGGNAENAGAIFGLASWQRLAEHFHTLFTTETSIDALKQTLLQLAVMGKLLPQDPSDEPASELLERIAKEKARLVTESKIKKQKPFAEIDEGEKPFELPVQWEWARLGSLSSLENGDRSSNYPNKSQLVESGIPFINAGHLKNGLVDLQSMNFITRDCFDRLRAGKIQDEDILFCLRGSLGKAAIVRGIHEGAIASSLVIVRMTHSFSNQYLMSYFSSSLAFEMVKRFDNGTAQPNLSAADLNRFLVPLPPLAEQHRIVAKVDQLMTLCDQLKSRLSQARRLNEQLASTLVERALAEDRQQVPVAPDRQVARTLLAAEITHRLHGQRTFGQRKLQKVIYLAEHAARLAAIQGSYLRNVAGPHDRQLMNQVEGELQNRQWYERIQRETVGHAYRPLSHAGQHRQAYESTWSAAERATIEQVIELMRDWDTDRCEKTVTLYAAWNDFILEGRPVTDEAIVAEVMHRWNDTKLRFSQAEWLAVLAAMKKHEALIPTGFGKRTTGGMLSLPGFE